MAETIHNEHIKVAEFIEILKKNLILIEERLIKDEHYQSQLKEKFGEIGKVLELAEHRARQALKHSKAKEALEIKPLIGAIEEFKKLLDDHKKRYKELFVGYEEIRKEYKEIEEKLEELLKVDNWIVRNGKKYFAGAYPHRPIGDDEFKKNLEEKFRTKSENLQKNIDDDILKRIRDIDNLHTKILPVLRKLIVDREKEREEFNKIYRYMEAIIIKPNGILSEEIRKNLNSAKDGILNWKNKYFNDVISLPAKLANEDKMFDNISKDIEKRIREIIDEGLKEFKVEEASNFKSPDPNKNNHSGEYYKHHDNKLKVVRDEIRKYFENIRARGEINRDLTVYHLSDEIAKGEENIELAKKNLDKILDIYREELKKIEKE